MPDEEDLTVDNPAVPREFGYPGGFDDFFRTVYRAIVGALMFEGACPADADDCAAHSMEKLLVRWDLPESAPGYVRHPRAYVMTTARRQLQKRRRMQSVALAEVEPMLAANGPALTLFEDQQFVANLLEHLPPAQRQVMHLIIEGYTPQEIAEVLHKKPNNVRQTAHQARKRLRSLLEPPATGVPQAEEELS